MLAQIVKALMPFLAHVREAARTGKWLRWQEYAKALVAAAVAAGAQLPVVLADERVSGTEGWALGLAAAVAFGAVWSTPNKQGE